MGGGPGTYTIAFLRAVPGMTATLFDLPDVIQMARERLESEGMIDRVTLIPGSYDDDELPQGHDLALLSAIIHSNSLDGNLELYRKVFRALKPGGRILIRDHVMEPDRTRPRDGAVFAINMLVGTSEAAVIPMRRSKPGCCRQALWGSGLYIRANIWTPSLKPLNRKIDSRFEIRD